MFWSKTSYDFSEISYLSYITVFN